MGHFFVSILILFASFGARAEAWTYKTTSDFAKPSLLALAEFQNDLEDQGFWTLDPKNQGRIDILQVDQVFVRGNFDAKIFLKFGMVPEPFAEWTDISGGVAYHGKTVDGVPYAMFFDGCDRAQAERIVKSLQRSPSTKSVLLRLIVPPAQAAASCDQTSGLGALTKLGHDLGQRKDVQAIMACANIAGSAAISTVGGPLLAAAKLLKNPSEFWDSVKKDFVQFKQFAENIGNEISLLRNEGLDEQILTQIDCALAGQFIASAGLTLLTGGAAAATMAKMGLNTAAMIMKIRKYAQLLMKLSAMKVLSKTRGVQHLIDGAVACAAH